MLFEVKDERRQPFHVVDKLVTWFWLPFIHQTGYALYNLYISLVNQKTGGAFPSIRKVAAFLDVSPNTVRKYNRILQGYGLIRIEERHDEHGDYTSHMYYILDPPALPEELWPEYERRKLVRSDLMTVRRQVEALARVRDSEDSGDDDPDGSPVPTDPSDSPDGGGSTIEPPASSPKSSADGGGSVNEPPASDTDAPAPTTEPPGADFEPPPAATAPPGAASEAKRDKAKDIKLKSNNTSAGAEPDVVVSSSDSQLQLRRALVELGVHARTAERLVRTHDNDTIRATYQYMLYRMGQGKGPENPGAWLSSAITDGYAIPPLPTDAPQSDARQTRDAERSANLEQTLEAQTQRERREFEAQRQALMAQAGVDEQARRLWAETIAELRARGKYSPVFDMAFLQGIEGEVAQLLVQGDTIRQIIERNDRHESIRAALRKVTGQPLYLSISTLPAGA